MWIPVQLELLPINKLFFFCLILTGIDSNKESNDNKEYDKNLKITGNQDKVDMWYSLLGASRSTI